jgi:two-component system nitrate/nitrite response regulator NarL
MSKLTKREKEILALLSDGADNNAIAQALVISPGTARTHVQNVLSKLGVHSRLEAAAFVIRNGIRDELQEATR